jgi:TRAP-type transport system small permease protein
MTGPDLGGEGQGDPSVEQADAADALGVLRPLNWIVALSVFVLMVLTAIDVAGRYFFNAPVAGGSYIAAVLMGVMIFAGLPIATVRNEHLRAGLLEHLFKGRALLVKECFVFLISLTALAALAYVLWRQGAIYTRTHAELPSIGVSLGSIAYLGAVTAAASATVHVVAFWRLFASAARR